MALISPIAKVVSRCRTLLVGFAYTFLYLGSRMVKDDFAVILAYHSVGDNPSIHTVTPTEFYKQMQYLRQNYNVVPLDDIVQFARGKTWLPSRAVAITFDDGYSDNFSNVYPYLKRYGLPATFFILTGYVGQRFALGKVPLRMLDWNQIVEMSRHNLGVEAHTVTHPDLCKVNHDDAKKNIKTAREEIEERTGKRVRYVAYPYSRYNDETVELVGARGFEGGFGGDGVVRRGNCILALNRIQVDHSVSFLMFKARLTKAKLWHDQVLHWLRKFCTFSFLSSVYVR